MPIDFDSLKKYKELDLGGFHDNYAGQTLDVWVNLARRVWVAYGDEDIPLVDRVQAFYCAVLGISKDEITMLIDEAEAGLFDWIAAQAMELVTEYSDSRKKAVKP